MIRSNKELLNYFEKLSNLEVIDFKIDDIIIKQDSYIKNIFIIQSGIVKCSRYNDVGTEFVQEFLSTGEIMGEIEVITGQDNTTTIAEITAMSEVRCYKLSISDFKELISSDNNFNQLIIEELSAKIRYKALRHSYNQTHTLEEILLDIKTNNRDILTLIHKNDLANYFGVTLRSFNRTLKNIN